ncbi:META domain-containing protein [Dactylosporangium sp. NPDC050588]|uniref:META domain-containing protein n=1 Tax=Dactylosporangium sp. NPDC050588 TaxID=3157211 RepID=UPI0033D40699
MRRLGTVLVVVLLSALGLAGCARGNAAGGGGPWGRTFLSQSASRPLVPGTQIELRFSDGKVGFRAGCNSISGAARIDSGRLVVSEVESTAMGCEPQRGEQDNWFTTFLQAGPELRLEGADLVLEGGGTTINFVDRTVAEPDAQLVGPEWTVDTLVDGQTSGSVPAGVRAYLTFTIDGKVTGSGGCNSLTGTYTVDTETITFTAMASTRKACSEAGIVESKVLHVLQGTVQFRIEASHLTLTAADGTGLRLTAGRVTPSPS